MDLILWRHCEAEDGVPDEARRLTPRGLAQAARVAHVLRGRLPQDCRIVVSPAVRAQQTAQALRRPFETEPRVASGAPAAAILIAAGWPQSPIPVLVVGHQPALGRAASLLVTGEETDRSIRTGGVVWLRSRDADGGAPAAVEIPGASDLA